MVEVDLVGCLVRLNVWSLPFISGVWFSCMTSVELWVHVLIVLLLCVLHAFAFFSCLGLYHEVYEYPMLFSEFS